MIETTRRLSLMFAMGTVLSPDKVFTKYFIVLCAKESKSRFRAIFSLLAPLSSKLPPSNFRMEKVGGVLASFLSHLT
jgi:hypothetical protein